VAWRRGADRSAHGDFWLFDARTLDNFHFGGDRSIGMEPTDDRDAVLTACQVRDAAWHFAQTYAAFRVQVPSRS